MIEIFIVMMRSKTDQQAQAFGGKAARDWVPFHMTTDLAGAHDIALRLRNTESTLTKVQSVLCDEDGHLSAMGLPAPLPVA